jgi:hypothetical protein
MPGMATGDDPLRHFLGSHTEDLLVDHIVREVKRGRGLDSVMADPFVVNRASEGQRRALLDRAEITHAVGVDAVARIKAQL